MSERAPIRTLCLVGAAAAILTVVGGCSQSLGVPSEVGAIDQLVSALKAKGLTVSLGATASPATNGYFSVSSRDVMVGDALLKAFEYQTARQADADAAGISADGQPNPRAHIGWISAPHFFKHGRLIVLYVGCAEQMLRTLEELMGPSIANGLGCG